MDRDHKLSFARQADLLGISRGSLHYEPRPVCEKDFRPMRRIDELHIEYPFAGSRMIKGLLRKEGFTAGWLNVATCMKWIAIQALYRKPNTSKTAPGSTDLWIASARGMAELGLDKNMSKLFDKHCRGGVAAPRNPYVRGLMYTDV